MQGILRAARYSLVPNALGYCGPAGAEPVLRDFISRPAESKIPKVKSLLKEFYGFYPYIELIAESNSLEPFDEEVVEAYWLGNGLLGNVPYAALQEMIMRKFSGPSLLPERIARTKADSLPQGMLPHHSMHVLHINFITPKLEPLLPNLANCLVLWAKVIGSTKKGLEVKSARLLHESGQLKLEERRRVIDAGSVPDTQAGDLLSVHWSKAVERITKAQSKNLRDCTTRNLGLLGAH